ncbi:C-type lectin lectoxin-Lio2-like [Glandiceps talaboti]
MDSKYLTFMCILGCLLLGRSNGIAIYEDPISAASCDSGYFAYDGYCYRFYSTEKDWHDALDYCRRDSYDSDLAAIHSPGQQTFIEGIIGDNDAWIGFHDNFSQNNYYWSNWECIEYTNWAPGEPSSSNERCVEIRQNKDRKWNDEGCSNNNGYVCRASPRPVLDQEVINES